MCIHKRELYKRLHFSVCVMLNVAFQSYKMCPTWSIYDFIKKVPGSSIDAIKSWHIVLHPQIGNYETPSM